MQTQVLIIGGGATGTAIARDLALRGVQSILIEKDDLNAGASGGNHGLLHSGARYVSNDQEAAVECREEGELIKRLMPQLVEDTGGIFAAVEGDDEKYIADFLTYCNQCGITCDPLTLKEAKELEPTLSDKMIAAYAVPDASVDPFKMALENIGHAIALGSSLLRRTKLVKFNIENNKIKTAICRNIDTGEEFIIEPEQVINAAGAWAAEVTSLANIPINIIYSKGTLLITNDRINKRVINRLRPPQDADILVPGGTVSILGTTSTNVEDLDTVYPTVEEANTIVREGAMMVPALESMRYIRAFCGVRPLFQKASSGDDDDSGGRSASRGFALLDHSENDVENFTTITGGKLTTFRLMAEKTADMVCKKLNVTAPCLTDKEALPSDHCCEWTEPALSPKEWMHSHKKENVLFCECEMVSAEAIKEIIEGIKNNNERPQIVDIGFRSRLGRGSCQGAFCGPRAVSFMYDIDELKGHQGIEDLRTFYRERWKGIHSILWGEQIMQAELNESIHCGLFDLELHKKK